MVGDPDETRTHDLRRDRAAFSPTELPGRAACISCDLFIIAHYIAFVKGFFKINLTDLPDAGQAE